ncbi:MAG: bifunctional folylpolyglutamate synthase/dihydrofolate synthase, partial [bacterium]
MVKLWTYRRAIGYLNSFLDYERIPEPRVKTTEEDLARFCSLLSSLGDPHKSYPVIHIVGTKGKGSTAALLASILRHSGYRVGLYTSPHLISVRERIVVDGKPITKGEMAEILMILRDIFTPFKPYSLSFRTVFEHLTAGALLYFARKGVDIAVIEAGMGARLDATNVVDPLLVIITPIGLDHTLVLGS